MYLIKEQDFQRQYQVPNSQEQSSDGNDSLLTQFIDGCVPLFLKDALGLVLFKDLDENNITDGALDNDADPKWKYLVEGREYTINGKLKKWNGLVYTKGAFTESLLIPFVYYHWLENELSTMTGIGEVVLDGKNSVTVNSNQRLVTTWNTFVALNQHECNTNYPKLSIIDGIPFTDWFSSSTDTYVSLIEFLKDHPEDYPDANMRTYNIKNQFGL